MHLSIAKKTRGNLRAEEKIMVHDLHEQRGEREEGERTREDEKGKMKSEAE